MSNILCIIVFCICRHSLDTDKPARCGCDLFELHCVFESSHRYRYSVAHCWFPCCQTSRRRKATFHRSCLTTFPLPKLLRGQAVASVVAPSEMFSSVWILSHVLFAMVMQMLLSQTPVTFQIISTTVSVWAGFMISPVIWSSAMHWHVSGFVQPMLNSPGI